MPFRSSVSPEILAYIDEYIPQKKAFLTMGWVVQSNVDQAIAELTAMANYQREDAELQKQNNERNEAFADRAEMLRNMTMAERKALVRKEQNDAAVRAYIARIEKEERRNKK